MEVISRLFNHWPAIQGELLYFINTFGKKLIKENAIFNETENFSKALIENSIPSCQALVDVDLSILKSKGKIEILCLVFAIHFDIQGIDLHFSCIKYVKCYLVQYQYTILLRRNGSVCSSNSFNSIQIEANEDLNKC